MGGDWRLGAVQLLACYWLATLSPPTSVRAFSAIYHEQPQGRKFGGYRIVPRACKDLTLEGKGVCMFNYDCTKRNGTVVGSCMDGFLFGACCRLPPGEAYLSLTEGPPSTRSTTLTPPPASSTRVAIHGSADTVLLHKDGTPVDEPFRPEDFAFGTKPEMFLPERTTRVPQKSTTKSWPQWEDNMVQVATIPASSSTDKEDNAESINHILSLLDDSRPQAEPATLSTWVAVDSTTPYYSSSQSHRPSYTRPTYTRYPSSTTQYVQGPSFQVTPEETTPEPAPTLIVLSPASSSTKRPTIITLNTQGDVVTYRPPPAATAKPIYHGVDHQGPLFTTTRPPFTSHPTYTSHYTPAHTTHRPTYQTHTQTQTPQYTTPTQGSSTGSNGGELLVAFPPVRGPQPNLTVKPEVVSWGQTPTILIEQTTDTGLIEDENLDNKVHKFVEKIVQSLQGNFVDLENVLLDGGTSPTPPTKKPTTTKKPPKRPTKKPTTAKPKPTPPLITRPPPRPSSSKPQKRPTERPSPTTTIFLAETEPQHSTDSSTLGSSTTQVDYRKECGVRPLMKNGRIVGGKGSKFGAWPWQALVREATWLGLFTKNKCGGVLITNKFVITAAHCQPGFLASLVAVFGEYDISGELEEKRSVSRNVKRVIVHRYYDAATFENDIALLELDSAIGFDQHIVPICMPKDDDDFTGRMATVTGWGRLKYGGGVPSVLQEVQVPVIENNVCQEMFHTAGHSKTILNSFICAGYANGQRDSCEGDSGGPLMVEREDGHWVLAGTVSHGIKCAAPYLPGVYMRTTYYKPWLQTITNVEDL